MPVCNDNKVREFYGAKKSAHHAPVTPLGVYLSGIY